MLLSGIWCFILLPTSRSCYLSFCSWNLTFSTCSGCHSLLRHVVSKYILPHFILFLHFDFLCSQMFCEVFFASVLVIQCPLFIFEVLHFHTLNRRTKLYLVSKKLTIQSWFVVWGVVQNLLFILCFWLLSVMLSSAKYYILRPYI